MEVCENCLKHKKEIWTPYSKFFPRESIIVGNWIELVRCEKCPQFWVESPYEPYAAFTYLVKWNLSENDWRNNHDIDNGLTILKWHRAKIREIYDETEEKTEVKEEIDKHINRSYGREPFGEKSLNVSKADDLLKK